MKKKQVCKQRVGINDSSTRSRRKEARYPTRDLIPSCGRRLCCTRQRMQLVVMAAVLAVAGAWQGCGFDCHPTNISIPVESCGSTEFIETTICAGQCYHEDPVYIGHDDWVEQRTCNGDWTYEVKHIKGCPVGVTYPVARNCRCTACNAGSTYCGRFPGDISSCLSF